MAKRSLELVRAQTQRRAIDLISDPAVVERILSAIKLGSHARPACAAEGIPGSAYDSIIGRGRVESQQWHEGAAEEPTIYAQIYDAIEHALGESFVSHTKSLIAAFDGDPRERGKWMLRRFGPEFAEAQRVEDLPTRSSAKDVRALLYAKLG